MSFLRRVREQKEREVAAIVARHREQPPSRPDDAARAPIRDFRAAVNEGEGTRIIAEVKKRSPSSGAGFRQQGSPARIAATYQRHGARALSVVVDAPNFGTSLADLDAIRGAVSLPVLAKDFVYHPAQVAEAWAAGADALLLIARFVSGDLLRDLHREIRRRGMAALVECHDAADIEKALAAGAEIVGVNNRDLAKLVTTLDTSRRLLPTIPAGCARICESGIAGRAEVEELAECGADAFLIGTSLLQSDDPGDALRELQGMRGTRVKICGLTEPEDARLAAEAGADILGVIFAPSPRRVSVRQAAAIRHAAGEARLCGVFVDASASEIAEVAEGCGLDLIQLHGSESPEDVSEATRLTGLPVIKAVRADEAERGLADSYEDAAYLLFDLPKGDPDAMRARERLWDAARRAAAGGRRVLLAGGLSPEDVARAVAETRPWGVDVASGVESSPGRKDPTAVRLFVENVK